MDPRALIPIEVDVEPTPMGRRPFNRYVNQGAGGSPFQPRGLFPATGGAPRIARGYDGFSVSRLQGIGPARAQVGMGTARRFVGLQARLRGFADDAGEEEELPPPPAAPQDTGTAQGGKDILLIIGLAAGVAAAYIFFDETAGTGAQLRRRRL